MEGLKPCPFCGSALVREESYRNVFGETWHYVSCVHCEAAGGARMSFIRAREAWNNRAIETEGEQ